MRALIRCVPILCLLLAATAQAARLSRAEQKDLFAQAESLFREGDALTAKGQDAAASEKYRAAALRYERIAREAGVRNGRLDYNIGNCYFRAGDLGRAILYYRRAQRLIPNDPNLRQNLRQNLAYARLRRADVVKERVGRRVARTLLFLHYDLSPFPKIVLAAVFLNLAALLGLLRLFRPSAPRWPLFVLFGLGLLFIASVSFTELDLHRSPPGVVVAESVVARKGDGAAYEPSFKAPVHAGMEFRLVERRADWYHIELPDGRRCWIPDKSARLVL